MRMRTRCAAAALLAAVAFPAPLARGESDDAFEKVKTLLVKYCSECHVGEAAEGGLDMARFDDARSVARNPTIWSKMLRRVRAGEMPPPDLELPAPSEEEVEQLERWFRSVLAGAADTLDPGPAPLRRLNKYEYSTTLRDLLGVHVQTGEGLPADGAGGAGFDNTAATLFLSPAHIEKYLQAARTALDYMATDPPARQLVFVAAPGENTLPEEAARLILRQFMQRAFRRPVDAAELRRYLEPYSNAVTRGAPFDQAVLESLQAVLIAPQFLFRWEQPSESPLAQPVGNYELATRLSYFLWSSMPDEELMRLAEKGKLQEKTVLREQVRRMLDARIGNFGRGSEFTKARALAENFMGQWLGTRELGREFVPDEEVFPTYDYELEFAIRHEPIYLFEHMLVNNRPLLDLLDCDYTYLTRELARHYGIKDADIRRYGQMEYVDLPEDSDRGGVLTMAAVLAVSSYPHRTSPVLRGKWILEKLLDAPPPAPPPDVPELPEEGEDVAGKTLRERLEAHRENAACAACHNRMDPLGFGLENYDAIGRWRDEDAAKPIDPTGTLPSGETFSGPEELKRILLDRKDDFVRMLTRQMLAYALGRGLVESDFAAVEKIVARLERNDYKTQELIVGIVESVPFRYKPGASVEEPTPAENADAAAGR